MSQAYLPGSSSLSPMSTPSSQPLTPHPSVTERMQAMVDAWRTAQDTRQVFLNCYLLMTSNMLAALDRGEFQDAVWVGQLLHHFADYYFNALAAYEQDAGNAPQVWRITHQAAAQSDLLVLQNLMLGVNAHINYDLVLTLVDMLEDEWPRLSESERQARYVDHCHVNDVIGSTIDTVQDEVITRLAPAFFLIDHALGPIDEWATKRLITRWRESVWNDALRMLSCKAANEREDLRLDVERMTLHRAEKILLADTCTRLRTLI